MSTGRTQAGPGGLGSELALSIGAYPAPLILLWQITSRLPVSLTPAWSPNVLRMGTMRLHCVDAPALWLLCRLKCPAWQLAGSRETPS
jgi:hypothetical protein